MKKLSCSLLFLLCLTSASAHFLWVETEGRAEKGLSHEVRVHFGEYTYGLFEKVQGDHFPAVSRFTLWLIAPDGSKTPLDTRPGETYYQAHFVPTLNGVYTVALNNDDIDVIDYTQYDFGIFKTHYHATAKVRVGDTDGDTQTINEKGLAIKQLGNDDGNVLLQVCYFGNPMPKQEVTVFVADLWSKKLTTDAEGKVSFALPWDTQYLVETTTKEEEPGTFKGEPYAFIWHCATYCIK